MVCCRGFFILRATGGEPLAWSKTSFGPAVTCYFVPGGRACRSDELNGFTRWTSEAVRASHGKFTGRARQDHVAGAQECERFL